MLSLFFTNFFQTNFFLYFFSSALVLYWTVQNLMTILQTLVTKREPLKGENAKEIKGNSSEKFDRNDGKQKNEKHKWHESHHLGINSLCFAHLRTQLHGSQFHLKPLCHNHQNR